MNLKKYIFRLKGVQPVLRLTTKDGAIFQNSDPISLAFAENSAIASTVLEWIMPPLAQRYMETCAQTKTSKIFLSQTTDQEFINFIEKMVSFLHRC